MAVSTAVIGLPTAACASSILRGRPAPIRWNQHGPAAQTPALGPLSTAVAGLQTQVAGLQGQVVTLQTRVATISVPPPTATATVPSPTPTTTATAPSRTPTSTATTTVSSPTPTATTTVPSPTPTTTATVPAGLQSLAITPAFPPSIFMSAQLTATGTFAGGSTRDLTASVQWVLAGTSGASLTPGGYFTCPGGGVGGLFSVTATLGTVATTVQEGCPVG